MTYWRKVFHVENEDNGKYGVLYEDIVNEEWKVAVRAKDSKVFDEYFTGYKLDAIGTLVLMLNS